MKPIWAWFGNDEPNYAYMRDGKKLLSELAAASPVPVYFRTHNLLTTGDGTAALKWGSTNAYTEDANGQPDLRLDDRRSHHRHVSSSARSSRSSQIGFMPEALSTQPDAVSALLEAGRQLQRHLHRAGRIRRPTTTKWGELVYQWANTRSRSTADGSRELVVGSLERAGHRLLARHAGRVHEALRLRGRRPEARAADREDRRAGSHRPERRAHSAHPAQLHRALPARHQLRDRQDRHAARFRDVPREGRAARDARKATCG